MHPCSTEGTAAKDSEVTRGVSLSHVPQPGDCWLIEKGLGNTRMFIALSVLLLGLLWTHYSPISFPFLSFGLEVFFQPSFTEIELTYCN